MSNNGFDKVDEFKFTEWLKEVDKKDTQFGLFTWAFILSFVCATGSTAITVAVVSIISRENGIPLEIQVEFASRVVKVAWVMFFMTWMIGLVTFGNFMVGQAMRLLDSYELE